MPDVLRWRLWLDTVDRLLEARGRAECEEPPVTEFVDVDERERSTDARGVDASE